MLVRVYESECAQVFAHSCLCVFARVFMRVCVSE